MLPSKLLLQNRYRIDHLVGQGGMGAVYAAHDLRLDHTVAVKQVLRGDTGGFVREAQLLARLRHPALPKVTDFFVEEAGQFLVMDYVPGENLETILAQRQTPFPVEVVLAWADQLLAAVSYLHSQRPPVLHRDIKPANLKVIDSKALVLLDFGLAKGKIGQTTDAQRSVAGYTLRYAAPEQIRGEGTKPRSDLYAVGATLYHLFTGLHPPDALQRALVLASGKPDPLVFPITEQRRLPPTLTAVLTKAMALEPAERFESANSLRQALQVATAAVATEMVVEAPARSPKLTYTSAKVEPLIRPTLSIWRRWLLWAGGLGLGLLMLLGLSQLGALNRLWMGFPGIAPTATIPATQLAVAQTNPTAAEATSTATATPPPTPATAAPLLTTPTVNIDPVVASMTVITATATAVSTSAIPTPQPTATPIATLAATATPPPQPTATLSPSPTATATTTPTLTPNATRTAAALSTIVAATLTAIAPPPTPTPRPSATPPPTATATATPTLTPNATRTAAALSTIVAATLTAMAPPPTATFTPRPIATATLSPTPTPTARPAASATETPQPLPATAAPLAQADLFGMVTLLEPADNETLGSVDVNFVWQVNNPSHPLLQQVGDANSEYLFELVVLSDPTQPAQARGLVEATKATTVRIKRSGWEANSWDLANGQRYYWTVRLGKKSGEHYEALGLLAEPRRFIAQTGGGNDQNSDSQPSRKD